MKISTLATILATAVGTLIVERLVFHQETKTEKGNSLFGSFSMTDSLREDIKSRGYRFGEARCVKPSNVRVGPKAGLPRKLMLNGDGITFSLFTKEHGVWRVQNSEIPGLTGLIDWRVVPESESECE